MEEERCLEPRVALLLVTVGVTTVATGILCAAIMTDHWEHIQWERGAVQRLATAANLTDTQVVVEWYLDGRVTRISVRSYHRDDFPPEQGPELASLYLVPMYGGIWTLCLALDEEEKRLMKTVGFPNIECINYLTPTPANYFRSPAEEIRVDWQHRMQNLSISCALVCLIILGSSAMVGAFGVLKHQISAVLVTGVMYLLAATFALFTLAIIHFKRRSGREDDCGQRGSSDGVVLGAGAPGYIALWRPYLGARLFTPAWSLELGWAGLGVCAAASTLWLLLAKVMRYSPSSVTTTILA